MKNHDAESQKTPTMTRNVKSQTDIHSKQNGGRCNLHLPHSFLYTLPFFIYLHTPFCTLYHPSFTTLHSVHFTVFHLPQSILYIPVSQASIRSKILITSCCYCWWLYKILNKSSYSQYSVLFT